MRHSVNRIGQVHSCRVAAVSRIRAEHVDALPRTFVAWSGRSRCLNNPKPFSPVGLDLSSYGTNELLTLLVLSSTALHQANERVQAITRPVFVLSICVARKTPKVSPVSGSRIAAELVRKRSRRRGPRFFVEDLR